MNINKVLTKDYENILNWVIYENEPNSKPIYRGVASGEAGNEAKSCPPSVWRVKHYLAKMGHHELKYVDRLAQLTLNQKIRKDLN
jgi:hypothetical protein